MFNILNAIVLMTCLNVFTLWIVISNTITTSPYILKAEEL